MLDLSKDKRCQSLETIISVYADDVRNCQISRSRLRALRVNPYKIKEKYPYPYNDEKEHNLLQGLEAYISSHPKEDQEQIVGHFLWKMKNCLCHPFERHMARIVDHLVALYPLKDKDKIHYIEYVLKVQKESDSSKFDVYQESTWYKMANFDLSKNEKDARRLCVKAYAYLKNKKVTCDKDAKLMYGMLKSLVRCNQNFTRDQIHYMAKFYFRLAEKSSCSLDSSFLRAALFREDDGLKSATLKEVFSLYAFHLKRSRKVNDNLYKQMRTLLFESVRCGIYGLNSRDGLKSVFDDMKGAKKEYVNGLKDTIDKAFVKGFEIRPSCANILDKARSFFMGDENSKNRDSWIAKQKADDLYSDIKANAKLQGLNLEHPTFWDPNTYEIAAVDKKLVNDVADIYVQAYERRKIDQHTEKAVAEMFSKIVCCNNYTDEDVKELQRHIVRNQYADDSLIALSKTIKKAYDTEQDIKESYPYYTLQKRKIIFSGGR